MRPPSLKKKKPSDGGLFNFDPNNLNSADIESIAQNADKLINVISNIKMSVHGVQKDTPLNMAPQNI